MKKKKVKVRQTRKQFCPIHGKQLSCPSCLGAKGGLRRRKKLTQERINEIAQMGGAAQRDKIKQQQTTTTGDQSSE